MNVTQALAYRGQVDSYERQENMWWLSHILSCSTLDLKLMMHQELTPQQEKIYLSGLKSIEEGQPLAYLIGTQPFWTLDLEVNHSTLVPRPDTEILVETALKLPLSTHSQILDLGTGSGAIALALASERPHWQILATDIASDTLAVAQRNAQKYQFNHVQFKCSHWYQAISTELKFDLIVSNPPYIDEKDPHLQSLYHEPQRALIASQNGLADLIVIIQQSIHYLKPNAWLIVEHGYQQGDDVRQLFQQMGFCHVQTIQDYGQNDRISLGQLK